MDINQGISFHVLNASTWVDLHSIYTCTRSRATNEENQIMMKVKICLIIQGLSDFTSPPPLSDYPTQIFWIFGITPQLLNKLIFCLKISLFHFVYDSLICVPFLPKNLCNNCFTPPPPPHPLEMNESNPQWNC